MPKGIFIVNWDERSGAAIIGNFPDEITIEEKILMELYSLHEASPESLFLILESRGTKVASYYQGPISHIYLLLLLDAEENGDMFKDEMPEIARDVIAGIRTKTLSDRLPFLFRRIVAIPTHGEEQRYARILHDTVKSQLILRLREEGSISKHKLITSGNSNQQEDQIDWNTVIDDLVNDGIIHIASVKGIGSEIIFLTRDFLIARRKPRSIIENSISSHISDILNETWLEKVKEFFVAYKPSNEENQEIMTQLYLNPEGFELLKLFRDKPICPSDLDALKEKYGEALINTTLGNLIDLNIIQTQQDTSGTDYYCLYSDFSIKPIIPFYLIKQFGEKLTENLKNTALIIEHIELLKREINSMVSVEVLENLNWLKYIESAIKLQLPLDQLNNVTTYQESLQKFINREIE